MSVAEGHITSGNVGSFQVGLFHWDRAVRQARTTDGTQMVQFANKAVASLIVVGYGVESLALALFSPLAIRDVQEGHLIALVRDGSTNTTVHATADQDNRKLVGCIRIHRPTVPQL